MRRKLICLPVLVLGLLIALAMGGAGKKRTRALYSDDDISYVCDINTSPFEKNRDERLVRYDLSPGTEAKTLVFHARGNIEEDVLSRITVFNGEIRRSAYIYFPAGGSYAFVPLTDGRIDALEMHETMQAVADSFELHTKETAKAEVRAPFRVGVFAAVLVLALVAAAVVWITDSPSGHLPEAGTARSSEVGENGAEDAAGNGSEKTVRKKTILRHAAVAGGIFLGAILAAKLIPGIMFGRRELAVYLSGAGLALYLLWGFRRRITMRTEWLFLLTVLILGGVLLVISPVGHGGWDTDMHYRYALQASGTGSGERSLSELLLMENMPDAAVDELPAVNRLHAGLLEAYDETDAGRQEGAVYLTHLPSGIGLALGRLFGFGFAARFRLGELMNLLVYAFVTFLAIRRLHSGKVLLSLIALIPTNVFLAANYGYDYWVLAFLYLGTAYFIGMRQEGDAKVRTGEVCVMAVSLSLACLLKQNYLPLALLPFFMPRKKIEKPLRYYVLCILPVFLLGLSLLLRSQDVAKSGGDLRGGSVDAAAQLSGILAQPATYLNILLRELAEKLSPVYYCKAVTNYGEFGYCDITLLTLLLLALIAGAAFADRDGSDEGVRGWRLKAFAILNYLGGVVLVLTAFYLVYTPVGAAEIKGVQARYFTPLLYPLLAVIGTAGIRFFREHTAWKEQYLTGVYLAEVLLFFGSAVTVLCKA